MKDFFEKAKKFLLDPKNAFDGEKKTDVVDAIKYSAVWLFISAILSSIVIMIFGNQILGLLNGIGFSDMLTNTQVGVSVGTFISSWIGGIIALLISGLWLHLWVYLLGGKNKLENTLKAILYGNTPSYVLGWIPGISMIAGLWSLVLYALGIMKLQNMSLGKTIAALVIAFVIPVIIVVVIAAMAYTAFSGITGMSILPF